MLPVSALVLLVVLAPLSRRVTAVDAIRAAGDDDRASAQQFARRDAERRSIWVRVHFFRCCDYDLGYNTERYLPLCVSRARFRIDV